MPRKTKAQIEQELKEIQESKEQRMLQFIYGEFERNNFEDKRIAGHWVLKDHLGAFTQMIAFRHIDIESKKHDDLLLMYRFGKNKWKVVDLYSAELNSSITKEMLGYIMCEKSNTLEYLDLIK